MTSNFKSTTTTTTTTTDPSSTKIGPTDDSNTSKFGLNRPPLENTNTNNTGVGHYIDASFFCFFWTISSHFFELFWNDFFVTF